MNQFQVARVDETVHARLGLLDIAKSVEAHSEILTHRADVLHSVQGCGRLARLAHPRLAASPLKTSTVDNCGHSLGADELL